MLTIVAAMNMEIYNGEAAANDSDEQDVLGNHDIHRASVKTNVAQAIQAKFSNGLSV